MSHFDEMTCMQYLDGQLERARAAELATHAESCPECRRLLAALEQEAGLLRAALNEEDEAVPARLLMPQAREAAPWAWLTAFGLSALGLYTLWTGIIQPWLGQLSQAGFGQGNLLAMLFFGGVFWKGWEDMLNLVQTLATGTLLILAIGLVMRLGRRMTTMAVVLGGLLAMLMAPASASAAEIRKSDNVVIASGETLANDLIAAGGTVRIDGTIEGDLIVFCESVTVNGRVSGDVIAFTRSLRIEGAVGGSIRGFANNIAVNGAVGRNLMTFTQQVELGSKGQVGGGVIAFSDLITLDGRVERDVLSFAERTLISGYIGGDARMQSRRLSIAGGAEIRGKTKYRGREEAVVDPAAKLGSPLEFEKLVRRPDYASPRFYWRKALWWGAAFVFGLVLVLLFPGFFREAMGNAERYGPAAGAGLVTLILTPVVAIIACITLVGIPVAIAGILLWVIALYSAQIFLGAWAGSKMMGEAASTGALVGRMAVGLLVIHVATSLPYAGGWIKFAVLLMGMGAMTLALYKRMRPGTTLA
jgi:cytoskeletal protein CcmA (bactofilin family)